MILARIPGPGPDPGRRRLIGVVTEDPDEAVHRGVSPRLVTGTRLISADVST